MTQLTITDDSSLTDSLIDKSNRFKKLDKNKQKDKILKNIKELEEQIKNLNLSDLDKESKLYKDYIGILNEYEIALNQYKRSGKEKLKTHSENLKRNVEEYKEKLKENSDEYIELKKLIEEQYKKLEEIQKQTEIFLEIDDIIQNTKNAVDNILNGIL